MRIVYKQPKLVLTGPDEMKAKDYVDETVVFLLFSIKEVIQCLKDFILQLLLRG